MDEWRGLLISAYGIIPKAAVPAPCGFSAKAAYRVTGEDGMEYFLKVYDKTLPTTRVSVERIDSYMPVLAALSNLPTLRGRVLTPIPARDGTYKAETTAFVYVLFLFVHGDVPGIQGMSRTQTTELAVTLARLHESGEALAMSYPGLAEDTSLPFCQQLIQYLQAADTEYTALYKITAPHAGLLLGAAKETLRLRDTVRQNYAPLVLCHGDAHGNNVIQSAQLVLADWEDVRVAPAEADLFIYAWHPHGELLLDSYTAARHGYQINRALLYFYVLRRRIEDVWVDIQRLTEESPDEAEAEQLLDWICRGIEEVRHIYGSFRI